MDKGLSFNAVFSSYDWDAVAKKIYAVRSRQVEVVLEKEVLSLDDFLVLLSPAAESFVESMAQKSHLLTKQRFGKTVNLYAPMYLSNECQNICTYCGFSLDNKIARKTLSDVEIIKEAEALKAMNFDHVLLVTGEASQTVGLSYIKHAVEILRPYFSQISIEVQPLEVKEYQELKKVGVHAVLVYQESYHRETYKNWHPKGKKSNFDFRLETPDRIGEAGIHKIGIGALLGLEDWRIESFFVAMHLQYLEKEYWQSKYSISFPRLRPAEGVKLKITEVTDKQLVQLVCAYRLFNQEVDLSLSTRESEAFRNAAFKLGFTTMSAGSKTNPGGYAVDPQTLEQFEISDERSPLEVATFLKENNYEPVWKDWDSALE